MPHATSGRGRIPFTVVGGFLGAGKTTLVNRLLRGSGADGAARRVAVFVNDFGAVNIDAALIASRTADTIALTNGCVCCQIGDDLTLALIAILDAAEPFDAIVVEASGVSDPWRIAQLARADPALALQAIVVLVDASAIVAQSADPLLADTIERQLRSADLVALNKIDLVDAAGLAAAREVVATTAGAIGIVEVREAEVPLELLLDTWTGGPPVAHAEPVALRGARSLREAGAAHGHEFESWSAAPAGPLAAARLRELLRAMPEGVLRLKGLVATDTMPWAELQFSGRHGSLRPALAAPGDGGAAVVAIGLRGRLPAARLAEALRACAVLPIG